MNYPSFFDSLRADIQPSYTDSLMHHGIKGMHWGVRRFQNPDGSLTPQGTKRYSLNPIKNYKQHKMEKRLKKEAMLKRSSFDRDSRNIQEDTMTVDKDISKLLYKANDYYDKYGSTDPRTKKAYWDAGYQSGKKEAKALINKYGQKYFDDQINSSPRYNIGPYTSTEKYARTQAKELSGIENNAVDRINWARIVTNNPKLTYLDIYKDMNVDLKSEDTAPYKQAEAEWFKKHGY